MMHLLLGDCLEQMAALAPRSVDLIVTDPPYRTISGGSGETSLMHKKRAGMLSKNDGKIFEHNDIKFCEYLPDFYRALKQQAHLYLMVNLLNLEDAMLSLRQHGFLIHNLLVARKQNATPNRWGMKNCEYVILARKGAAFPLNDCGFMTCHDWRNPVGQKSHPTEKSVELMETYIRNSSQPGAVVMDPFMGTGATGVACQNTGRRFIGIERDPKYFAIAQKRIAEACMAPQQKELAV